MGSGFKMRFRFAPAKERARSDYVRRNWGVGIGDWGHVCRTGRFDELELGVYTEEMGREG